MPLSPAQMAVRRKGITGSQIAVVAGLSPWGSPIDVWREKVEGAPGDLLAANEDVQRGVWLEEAVVKWYVHRVGRAVGQLGTVVHPDRPLVIATPDGVSMAADRDPSEGDERRGTHATLRVMPEDIALEVKCPQLADGARLGGRRVG